MNLIAVLLLFAMLATVGVLLVGLVGFFRGGELQRALRQQADARPRRPAARGRDAAGPAVPDPVAEAAPWSLLTRIYTKGGDAGQHLAGRRQRGSPSTRCASRPTARSTRPMPPSASPACTPRARPTRCWPASRTTCSTWAPICAGRATTRGRAALRVTDGQVERLEREIDAMNEELAAAELVRAAGRHAGRRLPPPRPHRGPPRRAAGDRAGGGGGGQSRPRSAISTGCRTTSSSCRARSTTREPATFCGCRAPTADPQPSALR